MSMVHPTSVSERLNLIATIKQLRGDLGMTLLDARQVVEIVAKHVYPTPPAVDTELKRLETAVEVAESDLRTLVRMVDYFVSHPEEYARWKQERGNQ